MRAYTLTKNKDVDAKIIGSLNDYELEKVCQVNKYVNSICNDEKFWINRLLSKFGKYLGSLDDIKKREDYKKINNWKEYYQYLIAGLIDDYEGNKNIDILQKFREENTEKISEMKSIKEIDDFLNKEELVKYDVAFQNLEYIEYFIERSKTDYRFFPLWFCGIFRDLIMKLQEYPEKIKVILNDPRTDPNCIILDVEDEIFFYLLKDSRLNLDGIKTALYHSESDRIKYLIPLYEKLGGNPVIYRHIFRKFENSITDESYKTILMTFLK